MLPVETSNILIEFQAHGSPVYTQSLAIIRDTVT